VPTFRDHTEPYLSTYTPVLPAGPGVCQVCHGAPGQGFDRCSSCVQTMRQVSFPVRRVVPISLYQTPGQLWKVLRDYKDGLTVTQRHKFTLQVAATIGRFLVGHQRCITGPIQEPWDLIVTVLSSKERTGAPPLRRAIGMLPPPFSTTKPTCFAEAHHRSTTDMQTIMGFSSVPTFAEPASCSSTTR
jgi:hypothetical protein